MVDDGDVAEAHLIRSGIVMMYGGKNRVTKELLGDGCGLCYGRWDDEDGVASMSTSSAANLSETAARLYVDAPLIRRKLQQWRPLICPFDALMEFVPPRANVLDVGCGCGL